VETPLLILVKFAYVIESAASDCNKNFDENLSGYFLLPFANLLHVENNRSVVLFCVVH